MKARLGEGFPVNVPRDSQLQKDIVRALLSGRRVLEETKFRIIDRKENDIKICEIKREERRIKKIKKVPKACLKRKGGGLRNLSPLREDDHYMSNVYENETALENKFCSQNYYYGENICAKMSAKKIEPLSFPEMIKGEKVSAEGKDLFGQIKTGVEVLEKENKRMTMIFEGFLARNHKINGKISDLLAEPVQRDLEQWPRPQLIEESYIQQDVQENYIPRKEKVSMESIEGREERDYDYKVSW